MKAHPQCPFRTLPVPFPAIIGAISVPFWALSQCPGGNYLLYLGACAAVRPSPTKREASQ